MHSENWGGVASMAGSVLTLAARDIESVVSTASFLFSEVAFARCGEKSWGYSLGCVGVSFGDGLLCFSEATAGNPTLRYTMAALTVVWGIGALRYPVEQAGKAVMPYASTLGTALKKSADFIPLFVGTTALAFRIPAIYTAACTGEQVNKAMLACNLSWGLSDILLGRLQRYATPLYRTAHRVYRAFAGSSLS